MSVCPWRDDFDYVVALHIGLLPFQSSIVVRVSVAAMLWRLTLQRPAREIISRHGVDKRSLLPLAARRDAVARNATARRSSGGTTGTLLNKLSKNANVTTSSVLNTTVQPTYVYASQKVRAEQRHGEQRCALDTQR
jgi:hypothetical protein